MSFFDKIKEIVTESDDDEYDDFYEDDKKDTRQASTQSCQLSSSTFNSSQKIFASAPVA